MEGHGQVFTKINECYIYQKGNIISYNLIVLDFVIRSNSHVKSHKRRGSVFFECFLLLLFFFFLHLHKIVEGLYFHCSLSVCVCLSVCLCVRHFL